MSETVRCDACPVMCYIKPGLAGACDRYANINGTLTRTDPHLFIANTITAIGAGTTYPDYKPAPFIVSAEVAGIDTITVVTEAIFSYAGAKIKVDTDRHLGLERAVIRAAGEPIGHVTTAEYGSQMLSLGGVHHLTGSGKKSGRVTCETLLALCNGHAAELTIDDGATIIIQANAPPIINGVPESRMRVGCGSATIGIFAPQWAGLVDDVVVVDDHITGVLSEHQAGKLLDIPQTGIRINGRRSTPGRYFEVAAPGTGWGGTDLANPLAIIGKFDKKHARPGLKFLMVSTTGEHAACFTLDESLTPIETAMPPALENAVALVRQNCEPALCSVLFMAGAGGSLRAGVTTNPVLLTNAVAAAITRVTCGGAPVYIWPGGGITFMVDVSKLPANAFGYVPTPALVAPIEFTMPRNDYERLGGHMAAVRPLASLKP